MNTNTIGIIIIAFLLSTSGARAQDELGVGVIVGEPTGISIKKWISYSHAIDGALAWSFSENDSVQVHADYLIHQFQKMGAPAATYDLSVYFGLGGRVKFQGDDEGRGRNDEDVLLGVRIPLGVSYLFATTPIDLFAEIVPILDLVPDTEGDINLAVGARLYF